MIMSKGYNQKGVNNTVFLIFFTVNLRRLEFTQLRLLAKINLLNSYKNLKYLTNSLAGASIFYSIEQCCGAD